MRTRKLETTGSVRRNDLRSVARVARVGVVEDGLTAVGKVAGRAKACLRVLVPIRVLGRARGAFEKVGAVLGE